MRPQRRQRARSAPLAVIVVVAVLAQWAPSALAEARYGSNAQFLFWSLPQSAWSQHVQEMSQDGVKIVRADAFWNYAEPDAPVNGTHAYHWDKFDAIVSVLAANQIRWQPIIDYSTPWAASSYTLSGPNLHSPPASNQAYAAYAAALAQRYGPNGSFWSQHPTLSSMPISAVEIWNEENNSGYWQPQPNAARYAALYKAARSSIHAVDPTVKAIVGGLTNPSAPFLQSMYAALGGASGQLDAVAIHPYAETPADMYADVSKTRAALDQHGDSTVPLDLTEFGWATQGGPFTSVPMATDQQRAQYVAQFTQTVAQSDCGIESIIPHTWVTAEQNYLNAEDWFGLVHPDGSRSATEIAYSTTIRQLETLTAPSSSSASLCAQELGSAAPSQPQSQPPLLPLLSLTIKTSSIHGRVTRPDATRRTASHHGVTPIYGACTQVTVTSAKTPVDNAQVTFRLRVGRRTRLPRGAVVTALTDRAGEARACWHSLHAGAGTVTVSARRSGSAQVTRRATPIRWGPRF